jgi:transcriptional regulator with XRE-family HTH domain
MSKKKIQEDQVKRIKEIGLFIKNWRLNEGYSQHEFSKITNKHANTILNIESGKNITVLTLLDCLDAMEMTISEFFELMK